MRYSRMAGAGILLGVGFLVLSGLTAQAGSKTTLKLYVPQADATVKIDGKEIAGRLAARIGSGLLSDVVEVKEGGKGVHSIFGGAFTVDAWWSEVRCARLFGDLTRPDGYGRLGGRGTHAEFFLEFERTAGAPVRLPTLTPLTFRVPTPDFDGINWQV